MAEKKGIVSGKKVTKRRVQTKLAKASRVRSRSAEILKRKKTLKKKKISSKKSKAAKK
jgi:hypothetical protein